jgi:hypothetical protein
MRLLKEHSSNNAARDDGELYTAKIRRKTGEHMAEDVIPFTLCTTLDTVPLDACTSLF